MPRPRRNRPPDPSRALAPEFSAVRTETVPTDGAVATVDTIIASQYPEAMTDPLGVAILTGDHSGVSPASLPESGLPALSEEWTERMSEVCAHIDALATDAPRLVAEVPPEMAMRPWTLTYANGDRSMSCPKCGADVHWSCHGDKGRGYCSKSGRATSMSMEPPSCDWHGSVYRWADGGVWLEKQGDPPTMDLGTAPNGGDGAWFYAAEIDRNAPVTYTNTVGGIMRSDGDEQYDEVKCGTFTATPEEQEELTRVDRRLVPLGDAIRSAREQSGVTMGDMARVLGKPVTWVSDVERGREFPYDGDDVWAIYRVVGGGPSFRDRLWDLWRAAREEIRAVPSTSPETRATIEQMQPARPFKGHRSPEKWTATPEERRAARVADILADPTAALEVYRAVVAGRVRIAEWHGRELVPCIGGDAVGRIYPTPNGWWAGRFGGDIEEWNEEDQARSWVGEQAEGKGWTVLPPSGGKR